MKVLLCSVVPLDSIKKALLLWMQLWTVSPASFLHLEDNSSNANSRSWDQVMIKNDPAGALCCGHLYENCCFYLFSNLMDLVCVLIAAPRGSGAGDDIDFARPVTGAPRTASSVSSSSTKRVASAPARGRLSAPTSKGE